MAQFLDIDVVRREQTCSFVGMLANSMNSIKIKGGKGDDGRF